ncbi:unnamed protein product, partial [Polarella glacialis]
LRWVRGRGRHIASALGLVHFGFGDMPALGIVQLQQPNASLDSGESVQLLRQSAGYYSQPYDGNHRFNIAWVKLGLCREQDQDYTHP